MKKNGDFKLYLKAMSHVFGQVVMPEVPLPRKRFERAKETKPRNRPEDKFRNELIKHLRKKSCKVWRVEPSFRGKFGLGDLWVECRNTRWAGWVECKSLFGTIDVDQIDFQEGCFICNVKYLVVRTMEEAARIYKEEKI